MKRFRCFFISSLLVFLFFAKLSTASDVVNVEALNSQIILLHFDDGYVRYHQRGESRQNEWVVSEPLDVLQAVNRDNYKIQCADGYYANPQKPLKVTRKSKGTEFSWLCQNYVANVGCVNSKPDHCL